MVDTFKTEPWLDVYDPDTHFSIDEMREYRRKAEELRDTVDDLLEIISVTQEIDDILGLAEEVLSQARKLVDL